jgi:hypothetical protein
VAVWTRDVPSRPSSGRDGAIAASTKGRGGAIAGAMTAMTPAMAPVHARSRGSRDAIAVVPAEGRHQVPAAGGLGAAQPAPVSGTESLARDRCPPQRSERGGWPGRGYGGWLRAAQRAPVSGTELLATGGRSVRRSERQRASTGAVQAVPAGGPRSEARGTLCGAAWRYGGYRCRGWGSKGAKPPGKRGPGDWCSSPGEKGPGDPLVPCPPSPG